MRRRPKYADVSPRQEPLISERHRRLLARLVGMYGPDVIASEANKIEAPRVGRRPRGNLPIFEDMALARWFEDVVGEYQEAGSRKPVFEAELDLYHISFDEVEQRKSGHFERWRKTTKKKRLRGRRMLLDWRAHLEEVAYVSGPVPGTAAWLRTWGRK